MRVPSNFRYRELQKFFLGAIAGGLLSWLVFLFMFGELQEKQTKTLRKQAELIAELEKEKNIWQDEFKLLNEKNKKMLTIQNIKVKIINPDKFKLDPLSVFEVEEGIKKEISSVLAKDLNEVFQSRELLIRTIENKPIRLNNKRYRLVVKEMLFYTNFTVNLMIEIGE